MLHSMTTELFISLTQLGQSINERGDEEKELFITLKQLRQSINEREDEEKTIILQMPISAKAPENAQLSCFASIFDGLCWRPHSPTPRYYTVGSLDSLKSVEQPYSAYIVTGDMKELAHGLDLLRYMYQKAIDTSNVLDDYVVGVVERVRDDRRYEDVDLFDLDDVADLGKQKRSHYLSLAEECKEAFNALKEEYIEKIA